MGLQLPKVTIDAEHAIELASGELGWKLQMLENMLKVAINALDILGGETLLTEESGTVCVRRARCETTKGGEYLEGGYRCP